MEEKNTKTNIIHKYIFYFIILTLLGAIIYESYNQRWLYLFVTILSLVLILFSYYLQKKVNVYLPSEIQIAIILFIYAGSFLGEVRDFYIKYLWWDSLLHLIAGFIIGLIVFGFMYVLYKNKKITTSTIVITILIFCITLALGVIWELFEYSMDSIFMLNMQKARNLCTETGLACNTRLGVIDTMNDFIMHTLGGTAASILAYLYLKTKNQFILNKLIEKFTHNNPDLFKKKRMKKI